MKRMYFKLRLKSAFKAYPVILITTLITIISIGAVCFFTLMANKADEEKQKIVLGVVGDTENTYLEIGLNALKNMESSRFIVDIYEMDEEEAKAALERREISGYVLIPDGYIDHIFDGTNIPAKYVTLNAPEGFGTIISAEVAQVVSEIVTESQNGMYSMQDIARDYKHKKLSKKINALMLLYMESILERQRIYDVETVGSKDNLSFAGYYICGMLLFLVLLWGISCNRIFSSRNDEYSRVLNFRGMKAVTQVGCEYLAYLVITAITLLLLAIIFGTVLGFVNVPIPELEGATVTDCIAFILGIMPAVAMLTLVQATVYEMLHNTVAAILVQFVFSVVFGYISGCFYPDYFFPETMQRIAQILPVGVAFSYMRKLMSYSEVGSELGTIALYSLSFFALMVGIRKYRITGDIKL